MFKINYPWVFLLTLLPWVIRAYVKPAHVDQSIALKIPFLSELMLYKQSYHMPMMIKRLTYILWYFIWLLLLVALANPKWVGAPKAIERMGKDIMLLVDISGSMDIPDMFYRDRVIKRIDAVKFTASRFIEKRVGDRIGLIVYGTQAYVHAPLTFDRQTVLKFLKDVRVGYAGDHTAIGHALALACDRLKAYSNESRIIILLTDGVNTINAINPIEAANIAAKLGIKIYTIGIGGSPHVLSFGADLDESTLRQIASIGNGEYFYGDGIQSLDAIYKTIDKLEPRKEEEFYIPEKSMYHWPLSIACLLFLLLLLLKLPMHRLKRIL